MGKNKLQAKSLSSELNGKHKKKRPRKIEAFFHCNSTYSDLYQDDKAITKALRFLVAAMAEFQPDLGRQHKPALGLVSSAA